MVRSCIVLGCQAGQKHSKFRFPLENPEMLEKWKHFIPMDFSNYTIDKNSVICEQHFEPRFLKTTIRENSTSQVLRLGAYPTVFTEVLGSNVEYEEPMDQQYEIVNEDLEENCRLCLKIIEGTRMELTKLMEADFYSLTGIQLEDEPILSKHICDYCYNSLSYCNFLREKFIQNQVRLQKQMEDAEKLAKSQETLPLFKQEEEMDYIEENTVEMEPYEESLVIEETVESPNILNVFPKIKSIKEIRTLKKVLPKVIRSTPAMQPEKPKLLECDLCEFQADLNSKESLIVHMKSHVTTIHRCSLCTKQFLNEESLQNHIKLMHQQNEERKHICTLCNQTFRKNRSLLSHIAEHHKIQKKYICDFERCGKQFQNQQALSQHSEEHRSSQSSVKTHLKYQQSLPAPVKREFSCKKCNLHFSELYQLTQHLNSHVDKTAKKEFQEFYCSHCGIKFSNIHQLQRHISLQHGDQEEVVLNIVNCEVIGCNSEFQSRDSYRKHILKNHFNLNKQDLHRILLNIQNIEGLK